MKNTFNDLFKSTARVIHLGHFHKGRLIWEAGEEIDEYEYHFSHIESCGRFPKMPVILQSNGLPWDIGNAYLLGQLEKPNFSNMRTLTARATHLKYYLQYLEDTGQHFLDLPKLYYERGPQKFRWFMSQALDNHDFSAESINNVLSTVAHFYKNIRYESLVTEASLENPPFTEIRKSLLFRGTAKVTSRDIRQLTSEYFIRKSQGKVSLVAKKLNNSIATTATSYTSIDIETQAQEMNRYHEELSSKIRYFNRTTYSPIPVVLASEDESERIATGSCSNIDGRVPSRTKGFNAKAPEPACGTFESCLFCEYFAIHVDFEDIHKLLSLKEALNATSMIRNDSEHHEAVVKPAIFRIDEILDFLSNNNQEVREVIRQAEDKIEMGDFNQYWGKQIEILLRRANSSG